MSASSEPIFYILVQPEGKSEADRVDATDTVLSFEFEDNEAKADLLKLTVDNWDLSNFDNPVWKPGNKLIVTWGYPGKMAPPRECIIQKVKGSAQLQIEGQSKAVLMNKTTKSRTFENKTRSQVVREIAKEYGFEGDQADIEDTDTVHEHITQARATDAQFIKQLADREHFEFYVDFDGLHWHARRLGQKPLRVLQYYLPPDVGDIISFDVENDIFAKPGQVNTKGRDPLKKKDVGGEGSNAKTDRDALNPITEIVDPKTGLTTFQTQAASSDTKPTTATSDKDAKKQADGAFKKSVQTTVKLTIEMVGDPLIVAKSVLDVRGISKRLSGLYYINQANHKISSSGYTLTLKCSTDGTKGHSQSLLADGAGPKTSGAATPATLEACRADFQRRYDALVAMGWDGTKGASAKAFADSHPDTKRLFDELGVVEARCNAIAQSVGKGKLNDGKGEKDAGATTMKEKIDPSTGLSAIEYHDTAGRETGEKK